MYNVQMSIQFASNLSASWRADYLVTCSKEEPDRACPDTRHNVALSYSLLYLSSYRNIGQEIQMPLPVLPVTKSSRNTLASASTNDPRWLPDSELFSPDNLSTPDGLDNATISLQIMLGTAKEASALVEAIVSGLLLLPHGTFPLILSRMY